jgi:4-amino-4-deoxy-L-arabinose transferase-like glycosyltransferase
MGAKDSLSLGEVRKQIHWLFFLVVILTVFRLVVAGLTPLAPDEVYYWVWSKALAFGYPDHPPMVALWIRAGTALLGDTELGVRLLGPLATAVGTVLLWRAAEDLLPARGAGLPAAVLANATLLFGAGAVTMTPDTPLLLFWTLAMFGLGRLLATGRAWWWGLVGVAAGLAMASKYTAVLLAPAVLVWLLAVPSLRPWLRRPAPWLGALAALAVFAPVLGWNATHDWVSFVRQGGRVGDWRPDRALQFVGELLGGQIGLATPLLAVMFGAGFVVALRRARTRDPGWTLLAALLAVPSLVFLQHALGDRVQANWPSLLYPQAAIAAAGLPGRWRRLRAPAVGLGFLLTGLVWVQAIWAPARLPVPWDITLLRLAGWEGMAQDIAAKARTEGADYVVADNYGQAAELAWHLPPDIPVLALDARWHWFDLPDAIGFVAGRTGLMVRSDRLADQPRMADFDHLERIGWVDRARGGMLAERVRLYRVVGHKGVESIVFMPRPHRR